ncbi:hypothetical protein NPIL_17351, partial [Nephila pilipes]
SDASAPLRQTWPARLPIIVSTHCFSSSAILEHHKSWLLPKSLLVSAPGNSCRRQSARVRCSPIHPLLQVFLRIRGTVAVVRLL